MNAMIALKAVKKNYHVLPFFTQKFTANFTAVLTKNYHIPKFTHSDLISQDVSVEQRQLAQWNKQFKGRRDQRLESARGRTFFVRIQRTRWKKIVHCNSPHSPQKDVKNKLWKIFFPPIFIAFLTKIHRQTFTQASKYKQYCYPANPYTIIPLRSIIAMQILLPISPFKSRIMQLLYNVKKHSIIPCLIAMAPSVPYLGIYSLIPMQKHNLLTALFFLPYYPYGVITSFHFPVIVRCLFGAHVKKW